jgi:hypothetical protein
MVEPNGIPVYLQEYDYVIAVTGSLLVLLFIAVASKFYARAINSK